MHKRSNASLVAVALLGLGALSSLAVLASASAQSPFAEGEDKGADKLPKCVHVRSEARYAAYGYDHFVEIENGCDKAVSCIVKTNVNSDRISVDVPAGQTRSVTTFRGSPAREFQADVSCKLQS